ncbi:MAG: carboxypeptidase regulatory-like domain-containing protein [Candidatus Sulfotelmatobacter sp.]
MRIEPMNPMTFAVASLLVLLLGSRASVAQNPSDSHAAAAIVSGVVTKLPGSDPVKKALIELIAENQSDGGNYTALTLADGSFRIENIAPGRYRLFVERTGYQEIDNRHHPIDGRTLTLTAGQEMQDLVIRLQAAAVIEGRVTDEDGDPMANAQVAVLRQTFVSGHSRWEQAGAERSNDLGEYRISGLAPGNYFVSVTPPPDFRSLIEATSNVAPNAARGPTDKPAPPSYQTTYYPGTKDRSQAGAIQLHAGDDFPVNFSLTPSPSLTVRGSVALPAGATASIMLQSKDFNLVLNGAEVHKDGTFEIRDVSPGAYTIFATVEDSAVSMTAHQSLQLASSNVEGLRLTPQTGGSVYGHLRIEGANPNVSRLDPTQIFLSLRAAEGEDDTLGAFGIGPGVTLARANPDGSLEWKNVPAGRYSVEISASSAVPDLFLKSITSAGRDAGSEFTVSGSTTMLDLVASANGALIDGVVTSQKESASDAGDTSTTSVPSSSDQSGNAGTENDQPLADAVVVAVPEARLRSRSDRYRNAVTDQRGHFTLRGLPPGEYTIFAWEHVDGEAYYNPDFLRSYEGQGKALRINEGERTSLQLKAIPVNDDQP